MSVSEFVEDDPRAHWPVLFVGASSAGQVCPFLGALSLSGFVSPASPLGLARLPLSWLR